MTHLFWCRQYLLHVSRLNLRVLISFWRTCLFWAFLVHLNHHQRRRDVAKFGDEAILNTWVDEILGKDTEG